MEKTRQLPISVIFLLRGYPDMCNLLYGLVALGILDALCNEGCEGHGTANGLPQLRMELAERSHEQTYLG